MRNTIVVLMICFACQFKAQLCFKPAINHQSLGEWSAVTGDFNNDNFMDLASYGGSGGNNTVMVLLGNGTGSLTLASSFTVNSVNSVHTTHEITTRDFNGDGNLDIAAINYGANIMSLFLGTGTGNFVSTGVASTVGSQPVTIVSTDFNNDGKADVAVANSGTKNISILLGTGSGNFSSAVNFPTLLGVPKSITVGDYNSDGKQDLAVGIQTTTIVNKIAIYIGNGLGNFTAGTSYSVSNSFPTSLETMDFNADGKSDIACGKSGNGFVGVFLGLGTGGFSNEVTYNTLTSQCTNILCGDYNSDGIADIATGSYATNELSVLLGNGSGGFNTALKYPAGLHPISAASADFNNDGALDVAIGLDLSGGINVLLNGPLSINVTGSLSICSGNSTLLTISGANTYTWSANAGSAVSSTVSVSPSATSIYTVNAVNGSCSSPPKTVMVTVTSTPTVSISQSAFSNCRGGSATFTASGASSYTWSSNAGNSNSPIVTVFPTCTSQYSVIGANGPCTHTMYSLLSVVPDLVFNGPSVFVQGTSAYSMLSKDFNNDGKVDIIYGDKIAFGDGEGNFSLVGSVPVSSAWSVTSSDFNGDGNLDLATANGNANVLVTLGNGNGTFSSPATLIAGTLPESIASSDLNGDSKADLVVANANTSNVSVFIGNGNGSFSAANNIALPNSYGSWASICCEDFNNDGKKDIAIAGSAGGILLLGTGTGGFAPYQLIPVGITNSMISADVNNDGNMDLAYVSGNQVAVVLGLGNGTFNGSGALVSGLATGVSAQKIISADFNNDTFKDLAVTDINSNTVNVLLGSGNGTFRSLTVYGVFNGSGTVALTAADFTGNGRIDLAVGNYGPGGVSVLLNGLDVYEDNDSICNRSYFTYHHGSFNGFNNVSLSDPFGGLPLNVPPYTPVTYSITANYSSCNYQETKAFTVIVKPSPTLSLTSTSTLVCLSAPFLNQNQYQVQSLITASGAVNYQFPWGPSSTTNTFAVTDDPNQPFINNTNSVHIQTFVIVGINNVGCSDMDTISLQIIPSFTVAVTSATSCSSPNCTLTAFSPSAVSYTWNTGQQGTPIIVQPHEPTPGFPQTFIATGINAYGCSSVINSPGSVVQLFPNQLTNFSYTTNSLSVTYSMTNAPYCNGNGFLWDFGNGMQNTLSSNPSVTYNQPGLYTACLKCGNNVPQECIACITFSLPSTASGGTDVGVVEYKDVVSGIKCYPNPSNGNFTLETKHETLIIITTILGETILTQKLQQGKNEVNLNNQSNGIYFIKNENSTFKVIKQ